MLMVIKFLSIYQRAISMVIVQQGEKAKFLIAKIANDRQ
jgi:hypothetical protein